MERESVFFNYLCNNKKTFIKLLVMFFLGMVLGIIFINSVNSTQILEINNYICELVNNIKNLETVNKTEILIQSIRQNISFLLLVWFLGCTIIGSGLIYIAIIYRGFLLGYTIAVLIACLEIKSSVVFIFSSLLMQNIIFLPMCFILAESGIKLYRRILTNYINIRMELLRHSAIMLISIFITIIASLVEVYISMNLLILLKNFL